MRASRSGLASRPLSDVVWRYIVASAAGRPGVQPNSFPGLGFLCRGSREQVGRRSGLPLSPCFCGSVSRRHCLLYRGFAPLQRLVGLLREMDFGQRDVATATVDRRRDGGRAVKSREILIFRLMFLGSLVYSPAAAQAWSAILKSRQAIDWSNAGVGNIPARTTKCASLTPIATLDEINSALASCPGGETVYLAAGTYSIAGTVRIPSNVTLRGAGADQTILNATGTGGGDVISLGSGSVHLSHSRITSGASGRVNKH